MNRPITRQRFTAAHELGHILMHTEIKANKFLCPIYIDSNNRDEYIEALQKIDHNNDYELLQLVIIKSIIKTMVELHKSWQ